MLKNIYSSLSGALAQEKVLEIIANNLSNLNTTGYKSENVTFKLLDSEPNKNYTRPLPPTNFDIAEQNFLTLKGNEMEYVGVSGVERDFMQGSASQTTNPFDFMIEGEAFFTINTKEGLRYTRSGSFSLSPEGALIDKFGNNILGEKGTVYLSGHKVEVNRLGEVYEDGKYIDKLRLTSFENRDLLEKIGSNLYLNKGDQNNIIEGKKSSIKQGYLESSNVNAIQSITDMIIAHRSYEAYQKSIKNYDSIMEKSSNSLGSMRV